MTNSILAGIFIPSTINAMAAYRVALWDKIYAGGGRDLTVDEEATLDIINNFLLRAEPTSRAEAGAVLETAIEQLQLFTHGEGDVNLDAVESALLSALKVLAEADHYRPAIYCRQASIILDAAA